VFEYSPLQASSAASMLVERIASSSELVPLETNAS
jgi:hypothetical protein